MKRTFALLLLLPAVAAFAFAQKQKVQSDWQTLVESERAFAAMSKAKGMSEAFLTYLADDSILFRPVPVDGKKVWRDRKDASGILTWEPSIAEVARSGEFGYTTGPWEFREKSLEENPVAHGYFVSVWKRQPGGDWKVAIDIGTSNPAPTSPLPLIQPPANNRQSSSKKEASNRELETERTALLKADRDFAAASTARGTLEAFRSHVAGDVRLYRQNSFPVAGRDAALAALDAKPGLFNWQPARAELARSADLGYTYGTYEFRSSDAVADKPAERGGYLRIWKRYGNTWKILFDITNPLPPPRPADATTTTSSSSDDD